MTRGTTTPMMPRPPLTALLVMKRPSRRRRCKTSVSALMRMMGTTPFLLWCLLMMMSTTATATAATDDVVHARVEPSSLRQLRVRYWPKKERTPGEEDSTSTTTTTSGNINFESEYYKEVHGDNDHLNEYHPEEDAFEQLLEVYKQSPTLFKSAVNKIYFQYEETTYPRYPKRAREPGFVASVPVVPEGGERDAFTAAYLNRTQSCPSFKFAHEIQYPRWDWSFDNLDILVNQLRLSGFDDSKIEDMFMGVPMWVQNKTLFDELRRDLSQLAYALETEANFTNVGIVFTGSSVNGFSQNPCKRRSDIPTWITSVNKSDVDISIHAGGVLKLAAENNWRFFPTTIDEYTTSSRFPISTRDAEDVEALSETFGDGMKSFVVKWTQLLPGGLQMTAYDDDNRLPPWETRAVYGRRRRKDRRDRDRRQRLTRRRMRGN